MTKFEDGSATMVDEPIVICAGDVDGAIGEREGNTGVAETTFDGLCPGSTFWLDPAPVAVWIGLLGESVKV